MNYTTKKLYRDIARKCAILAWILIAEFLVGIILIISFSHTIAEKVSTKTFTTIFIIVFVSMIFGLIANFISDIYRRRLIVYKNNIREYRIRREYRRALQLFKSNDLKEVVNIYNKHIPDDHRYKDLLYISLIHEFMHSNDETMREKGNRKFAELIAENDPNKIFE